MDIEVEKIIFPYKEPLVITGRTILKSNTVRVTIREGGFVGRGEALGVYYLDESAETMIEQLAEISDEISSGLTREALQEVLPSGGARNALDSALWDIEAKRSGASIWSLVNVAPRPLTTVLTLGIGTPEAMAQAAFQAKKFSKLKIKLDGDRPVERLELIREVRPDANIVIDINQGWSFLELKEYLPFLQKLDVSMIEQPLPRGGDDELEGFVSPVMLGADESCLNSFEYENIKQRYDVVNIKLDKCGGLTEALKIVELAKRDKKYLMVGNMGGSSLSMAPEFVVGQFCNFVDIDGPLFLANDIDNGFNYDDGGVVRKFTSELWG